MWENAIYFDNIPQGGQPYVTSYVTMNHLNNFINFIMAWHKRIIAKIRHLKNVAYDQNLLYLMTSTSIVTSIVMWKYSEWGGQRKENLL